jgi:hypothetical protein
MSEMGQKRRIEPLLTLSACPLRSDRVRTFAPQQFDAMALFGRRSPERVARSSSPASENLHRTGLMQCSKQHHYSITSSAVASSDGGRVRSSILAVSALMTSSNLVGRATGRSAGFAPLRMRAV